MSRNRILVEVRMNSEQTLAVIFDFRHEHICGKIGTPFTKIDDEQTTRLNSTEERVQTLRSSVKSKIPQSYSTGEDIVPANKEDDD